MEVILSQIRETRITREQAMNIPAVAGCLEYIGGKVAALPIKLYREGNGKVREVTDDRRVRLLNDDTGDILSGYQWKRAAVEDYLLEGAAYLYKNNAGNRPISLHYVENRHVSAMIGEDPIFKTGRLMVMGREYPPFAFIKITRATENGLTGTGILSRNREMLSLAYGAMVYENALMKTGGNKRGFLSSAHKLTTEQLKMLKEDFERLYSDNTKAVITLNNGVTFQPASSTSVELQLAENKERNAAQICQIFGLSPRAVAGGGTKEENSGSIKNGVMPVLAAIEAALNKDYLLEREKADHYFAFDTKELDKGDIAGRYAAYTQAVNAGWISKNEIRYKEDLEPIEGLDVVTMSLGQVLFDIKKGIFFTPNMDAVHDLKGKWALDKNKERGKNREKEGNVDNGN